MHGVTGRVNEGDSNWPFELNWQQAQNLFNTFVPLESEGLVLMCESMADGFGDFRLTVALTHVPVTYTHSPKIWGVAVEKNEVRV